MKPKKSTHPLAARVKKMMQADDDIGKIAQASPVLVGHATELFIKHLMEKAASLAASRNAALVTPAHMKAAVLGDDMLDFVRGIVENVPDLGEEEETAPAEPKSKRRRKADGDGSSPTIKRSTKGSTAATDGQECKPEASALPAGTGPADAAQHEIAAGMPQDTGSAPAEDKAEASAGVKAEPEQQLPSQAESAEPALAGAAQQPVAAVDSKPLLAVPGMVLPVASTAVLDEDDYDAPE